MAAKESAISGVFKLKSTFFSAPRSLFLAGSHARHIKHLVYVQEVERLKGLRYVHSLALEAMDVAAPLFQRLLGRLGDAVSWLLVRLIGRSLGLIYRGVRESLVPRGRNPGGDKSPSPQLDGF